MGFCDPGFVSTITLAAVADLTSLNWAARPKSMGIASSLTYTGFEMELELASEAVFAVGIASALFADSIGFVSRFGWSRVCPLIGLAKPKVADAASTATKKGDKRVCLRSFSTSTHHVDSKSAISFLFVVHCPLSAASFSSLPLTS